MSKKKRIPIGVVQIDTCQVIRKASRDQFGRLATKTIPDKTKYNRKHDNRRNFRDERDAGIFFIYEN